MGRGGPVDGKEEVENRMEGGRAVGGKAVVEGE